MPTGFHAHTHLEALLFQFAIELLRFFPVRQPQFSQFTALSVDKRNLLEPRMIVTAYNQHVRLLSSEPFGWFAPPKSTRLMGADIVMESLLSLTLTTGSSECNRCYQE